MEKYKELHEGTQALYDHAILQTNLGQFITITVFADDRAKEIYKVNKASPLLNFRSGDDVIIIVNEKVIDQLTPAQRIILVEESLASISYDTEKDALIINKPDVVTFSGLLSKVTFPIWNTLRESIKSIYDAEKAEKDETKTIAEKAKKSKKKY